MKTTVIWLVRNIEQIIIYKMTGKSDSKSPQLTTSDYEGLQVVTLQTPHTVRNNYF